MEVRKTAISGVKWTTISSAILAVSQLLKISVLARFLDKEEFGLLAIILFVLGFFNVFMDMGLSSAILHKTNITKKEFSSLFWFNIVISFGLYILLFLITPFFVDFYDENRLSYLLPLLGLSIIISSLGRNYRTFYQKKFKFKVIAIVESIAGVLSLLLAITLAIYGYGILSIVLSTLFQYLFINLYFLFIALRSKVIGCYYSFNSTKPFLKIGLFQTGAQIMNYFNRDLDIMIVGKLFGPELLGGYSLAKQLVFRPAQIINPILTKVATPLLVNFQNDRNLLKKNYLKLLNIVSTINIPIYFLIFVFSTPLVVILYGKDFENISNLVRIMSLFMIIRAIGNPIGSLVIATGRTDLEFYWNFLLTIIVPVSVLIGSKFGILGVVWSILIIRVILFVPSWYFLIWKTINITFRDFIFHIIPNFKNLLKYR